ncbi:lipid-A-disaccharide kinase [Acinetobacter marinus]|uniref:Tetraacyldisaccharide 4'-kinase n=1 Tax=Acinetobacter marinus TaxID=281375 RepID=A0A1G6H1W5_9GAMM|nr:tetraacyldisaccharide 4'-kinase [Acinetobacter marinus]SDB87895.1 lipid-A-disaccharide kinase [Acinetobacter marinus]
MSLAEQIQKAWHDQAKWLVVLRPFSWLYRAIFLWQKTSKSKHAYRAPVPVMISGNITVGGSGKTPLIIALVEYLQSKSIKVGVISRGYGGKGEFPLLVTSDSTPEQVGDEPTLIVQRTHVPMAVGPNRQDAIELLLQHHHVDLILSDDGLQHFALQRDLEWVVVDANRGFGNEKLLPEGYLREPLSRLDEVTVIEHSAHPKTNLHMHLEPSKPYNLADRNQTFDVSLTYDAVVGIGFPQRFFNTLDNLNISYQKHAFADHHAYQASDFSAMKSQAMITTEKDAVKLKQLWHNDPEKLARVWVVPVQAVLSGDVYQLFNKQLLDLNPNFKINLSTFSE